MSEKKIIVPDEMLKAFHVALCRSREVDEDNALEAALRWLSENPIVLSLKDAKEIQLKSWAPNETCVIEIAKEAQRRMFVEAEPEVPEPVQDLLGRLTGLEPFRRSWAKNLVLEAYRRGKESK